MRRSLVMNVCLSVLSVSILFISIESVLRIIAYKEEKRMFHATSLPQNRPPRLAFVSLGEMIQVNPSARIIYELKPYLEVIYMKEKVTTSRQGFRDDEFLRDKPRDTIRIVGIGDSVMFGNGVSDKEMYLALLEEKLNESLPFTRWEVINAAVPGYNAVMEIEAFKQKLLPAHPDIVIVGHCINDFELPNFIRKDTDFSLRRSFLVDFVVERFKRLKAPEPKRTPDYVFQIPSNARAKGPGITFEGDPSKVPPRYVNLVGWRPYEEAMRELSELSKKYGFLVLVVSLGNSFYHKDAYTHRASRLWSDLGFVVINVDESIERYMKENNIGSYYDSPLTVSRTDGHPSAFTHRLAAEVLFSNIVRNTGIRTFLEKKLDDVSFSDLGDRQVQ